jgi:hypothetical protein
MFVAFLLLESELGSTFVGADIKFVDSFLASNAVHACVSRFLLLNDVEDSAEKYDDGITMMETMTVAGFDIIVVPPPHPASPARQGDVSNITSRASL